VLYAAGAAHRNTAGSEGFEQIEIEFDPSWRGSVRLPDGPVSRWIGGPGGTAAKSLARFCSENVNEDLLLLALRRFLEGRFELRARRPHWLDDITRRLRDDPNRTVSDLRARRDCTLLGWEQPTDVQQEKG
jgi:hypothetical protein